MPDSTSHDEATTTPIPVADFEELQRTTKRDCINLCRFQIRSYLVEDQIEPDDISPLT